MSLPALSSSDTRRHIARNVLIVAASFGLAAAAGLFRNAVIASSFGIGSQLDAYYAAFKLPDLLFTVVAGGALATAFIPVFADYTARGDQGDGHTGREAAWRFTAAVLNWVVLIVISLALLAAILAPRALTTHFKNYRIARTPAGLALENCSLGEGEIDIVAIAELLAQYNPDITLNIEIHTQSAFFRCDVLQPRYWEKHPSPPGDGLSWYLAKAWTKPILEQSPADLPDGAPAWKTENEDIRKSISWAKNSLHHLLTK